MAREVYPTDELGMALPVLIPQSPKEPTKEWNRHHAWYYARRFLSASEGARVQRFSRLQYLPVPIHNKLHRWYGDGAPQAENEYQEFKLTLLGIAGYIPDEGLRITRRGIKQVEVSPKQRRRLRQPGVFTVERSIGVDYDIGDFLMRYTLNHGLEHIVDDHESWVGRFLEKPNADNKEREALAILAAAAEVAVEPLDFIYASARMAQSLRAHAPRNPRRLIMGIIKHEIADVSLRVETALKQEIYGPSVSDSQFRDLVVLTNRGN